MAFGCNDHNNDGDNDMKTLDILRVDMDTGQTGMFWYGCATSIANPGIKPTPGGNGIISITDPLLGTLQQEKEPDHTGTLDSGDDPHLYAHTNYKCKGHHLKKYTGMLL